MQDQTHRRSVFLPRAADEKGSACYRLRRYALRGRLFRSRNTPPRPFGDDTPKSGMRRVAAGNRRMGAGVWGWGPIAAPPTNTRIPGVGKVDLRAGADLGAAVRATPQATFRPALATRPSHSPPIDPSPNARPPPPAHPRPDGTRAPRHTDGT